LRASDSAVAQPERLVEVARQARGQARAPYSGFHVGAALLTADGQIHSGCNIENASYGLTICAERVALFKALSEGAREFVALAVVTDAGTPTSPCGACRQLLWEYCGEIDVWLANLTEVTAHHRLADLFPVPFDAKAIGR
jgi:cytidine deaminase